MLVKKTIEEQIALIEADKTMVVLEVTKYGNFICIDKTRLDDRPFIDDENKVLADFTVREHISTHQSWAKYRPKLKEMGIID